MAMTMMQQGMVRVEYSIPAPTWWRLAAVAERHAMTVDEYLAQLATAGGRIPSTDASQDMSILEEIRTLKARNMSNGAIALELGISKESVRRRVLAMQKGEAESSVAS
jgi:hypothetical protein